jgi:hypothetical protein
MEIEINPVTLDQRIEHLKQAAANTEVNKKSFPWAAVIISVLTGAGICLAVIYWWPKKKDKENRK